mmetsp:Transcript_57721/g.171740  ORF Transcript_57721/g.171740 Transcript_57721/m.171740 type:complete len:157 (+) Transcript_57721:634-1104(+)
MPPVSYSPVTPLTSSVTPHFTQPHSRHVPQEALQQLQHFEHIAQQLPAHMMQGTQLQVHVKHLQNMSQQGVQHPQLIFGQRKPPQKGMTQGQQHHLQGSQQGHGSAQHLYCSSTSSSAFGRYTSFMTNMVLPEASLAVVMRCTSGACTVVPFAMPG